MPKKIIGRFEVERLEILSESGDHDEALFPSLADKEIQTLYEWISLARAFDSAALSLQREGRLGTYASILGQEAAQVGSALALEPADWIFPAFREIGVGLVRGVPMKILFQYWAGDERGNLIPPELHYFTTSIPVGTHLPHAVGAAWAMKLRKERSAVVTYFGDGATSKGDFHEAMNFAGVHKLPVVFICQNNQWAISVPLRLQTASESLAQKAVAYGFPGLQVDGNDPFAVYAATRQALERARSGAGPTFIEALTYRLSDHTTADDASRYRSEEEVAAWRKKDPIARLEKFMARRKLWDEAYAHRVKQDAEERVAGAVRELESEPPPDPSDMIRYTYDTMPRKLVDQEEELKRRISDRPSGDGKSHG